MRRLLPLALVALALVTPAAAEAATALYPDMKTLAPRNLRFDTTDVSQDSSRVMHNVLRFSNTVVNEGQGPVEIRATIDQRLNPPAGPAFQRIYNDDGTFRDIQLGASTLYYHAVHVHYHFDHWGEYQLWTKPAYDAWIASGRRDGEPDLVGQKTTSCVMDEEFARVVPSAVWPDRYPAGTCMPNERNVIAQGLSSGWGDTYDYYRFEQWIDLGPNGRLADGTYVLRSVSDPYNLVHESEAKADVARENPLDNEATRVFSVSGGRIVDTDAPDGTLTLNHLDEVTNSPTVRLDVLGRDDVAGVTEFRVSNDGGTTWNTFANTSRDSKYQALSWDITRGAGGTSAPGTKVVCVMFKDATGKWGPVQRDTIQYDPPGQPTSAYGRAVQADAPVGWWRLGEASGTLAANQAGGDSGTYTGTRTLGQPSLVTTDSNTAVAFPGSGSVAIPDSAALDLRAPLTLEAWIRPARIPPSGSFASVLTKPEAYSLQFNGPRLEFTIMQNRARKRLQTPTALVAGQTYHVVGTYDGTTQRLYVNGAQVASVALTGSPTATAEDLRIAAWNGGSEWFNGTVDEPAVYASALSAARVRAHWDAATTDGGSGTLDAPSGLNGRATSSTAIALSWNDNASGDTGQVLERSTDAAFSAPTSIALSASATSHTDSGLTPRTTYWYRVRAVNGTTTSAWSNTASATTQAAPSYHGAIAADIPVSYWRLGETSGTIAGDETVVGPGTFVGSPILGVPSLVFGSPENLAIGFNGATSEIRVGQTGTYDLTNAISLESWIKPTALPAAGVTRTIVAKTGSYALQLVGPTVAFTLVQGGVRRTVQAPAGTVAAGVTAHVAGTFDGTTQRLYVDGVEVASAARSGTADLTFDGVRIGSWDGASEFFAGTIDDPSLWGKALTPAQVAAHFAAGQLPLGAPVEPSATPVSAAQVDLAWTDTSNAETAVVVQRSTDAAFSAPASVSLPAGTRRWSDTRLSGQTDYWYRVRAVSGTGSSDWSPVVTARTPAAPPVSSYPDVVAGDAPVSWWRLGEASGAATASDQQGANAGTYGAGVTRGAASLVPTQPANAAATFSGGSGSSLTVRSAASLQLTSGFAVEAWIRPSAVPTSGAFASVVTKAESYSLQFNGPRLEFTTMQAGTRRRTQAAMGAIVAGSTYHVVGTYDGMTQRLFLNGAQVASTPVTGAATANSNALQVGTWDGSNERYRGTVDEIALYGRALTATQVLAHWTAGTRAGA